MTIKKTSIIITRHGETDHNKSGRYQGRGIDLPLNAIGISQAEQLGRALKGNQVGAIYVSPAKRAVQTASLITQEAEWNCKAEDINIVDGIGETHFGEWEGLNYQEITATWPDLYSQWLDRPSSVKPPGGEGLDQVAERSWRTCLEIADRHQGERVLLVTHGGPIMTIITTALGMPLDNCWRLMLTHCRVNLLHFYGSEAYVELINSPKL